MTQGPTHPHTISSRPSRPLFWFYVILVTACLFIPLQIALDRFRVQHGWPGKDWTRPVVLPALVALATALVNRILRHFGASLSGRTIERRARTDTDPVPLHSLGTVELRYKRLNIISLGLVLALGSLGAALAIIFSLADAGYLALGLLFGPPFFVLALVLARAFWLEVRLAEPYLRIDPAGVMAQPSFPPTPRQFVPWSDIATCEIDTRLDTWGRVYFAQAHFLDPLGNRLLTAMLPHSTPDHEAQRAQALVALRAYLPSSLDPPI